jgi:hypothetical protein
MRSNEPLLPETDGQNSSDSTEKDGSPEDDKNGYLNGKSVFSIKKGRPIYRAREAENIPISELTRQ